MNKKQSANAQENNKAQITIGYKKFVMSFDSALAVMKAFEDAEFYEDKWHASTETAESYTTHHLGTLDADVYPKLSVMPNALYHVARVAGPAESDD